MAKHLSEVIADYIVKQVKGRSSDLSDGLNWIVSFEEIEERFLPISRKSIFAALGIHEAVADVQMDPDGFDVVIYGGEEHQDE